MNPPGRPAVAHAPGPRPRVNPARRPLLSRIPRTVWKLLAQYLVGFGLLVVIIYWNWTARPGKPNDDQKAVAFLAGSRARFINGQVIRVDGGFTIFPG